MINTKETGYTYLSLDCILECWQTHSYNEWFVSNDLQFINDRNNRK